MKRIFLFFLLIILISKFPVLTGCANMIPPQGGPRDSLAPKLIKASPVDSTRNFTGTRITFSFDEGFEGLSFDNLYKIPSGVINPKNINERTTGDTNPPKISPSLPHKNRGRLNKSGLIYVTTIADPDKKRTVRLYIKFDENNLIATT